MVSIDRVYQTVLALLDKEQRGYLPQKEFNLIAPQAQIEVYEKYFADQAVLSQHPMNDMDYSDTIRNIEEKIAVFETTSIADQTPDGAIALYPANFWRLGRVIANGRIADEVSQKDAVYVGLSPLTAPSETQPIYTREALGVRVYANTPMSSVQLTYVRTPTSPIWDGAIGGNQLVFNVAGSTDFELHPSEEPKLVVKILAYVGVIVKAEDVIQPAQKKEQQLAEQ